MNNGTTVSVVKQGFEGTYVVRGEVFAQNTDGRVLVAWERGADLGMAWDPADLTVEQAALPGVL